MPFDPNFVEDAQHIVESLSGAPGGPREVDGGASDLVLPKALGQKKVADADPLSASLIDDETTRELEHHLTEVVRP